MNNGYEQAVENLVFNFKDMMLDTVDLFMAVCADEDDDRTEVFIEIFKQKPELEELWKKYLEIEKVVRESYKVDKKQIRVDVFTGIEDSIFIQSILLGE